MKRLLLLLILYSCIPLSAALTGNLGKNVDAVFIFHPERLAQFPFYSIFKEYTLCGKTGKIEQAAKIKISAVAMAFSGNDTIFLMESNLIPEQFQKTATDLDLLNLQPVRIQSHKGFRFSGNLTAGSAILLFTGKNQTVFGEEKIVRNYMESGIKGNNKLNSCLAFLRKEAAAYGVLTSTRAGKNGFLQSGNAKDIAFSLSRINGMPSPVMAEVLFFPVSQNHLLPLYREIKNYIENVYRSAGTKGQISAEMRHAFTVTMSYGFVRLDMALTDAHAKDFFRILLSQWKN